MTKAEVISEIVHQTGIDKLDVKLTVETLFKVIKNTMLEKKNIHFRGFGSFVNKKKASKIARNIAKNTAMIIEEHYVPSFRPAKDFVAEIKAKVK